MVVESAAALPVDDVSSVLSGRWGDDAEVGAAWEPEPELSVEVLDLTALPRRVRLTKPAVDPVGRNKVFPLIICVTAHFYMYLVNVNGEL